MLYALSAFKLPPTQIFWAQYLHIISTMSPSEPERAAETREARCCRELLLKKSVKMSKNFSTLLQPAQAIYCDMGAKPDVKDSLRRRT